MKGMRKIKRGSGFRGCLDYVFNRDAEHRDQPGQLIGGNMSGENPRTLAHEFGATRQIRGDIARPVWHNSLRLPPGEHVSPAKLVEIADDYMQRIGFTDLHLRSYVLHDDKDGQHVHIVASRVALDGSIYLGRNENLESTRHIQALEREHNLTITKGPEYDLDGKIKMPEKKALTTGERNMQAETGKEPPRKVLQRLVDDVLATGPQTAPEFRQRLEAVGVKVRPNLSPSTGKMSGFSFGQGEIFFSGSKLGSKYGWAGLQKNGVSYRPNRDWIDLGSPMAGGPMVQGGADRLVERNRESLRASGMIKRRQAVIERVALALAPAINQQTQDQEAQNGRYYKHEQDQQNFGPPRPLSEHHLQKLSERSLASDRSPESEGVLPDHARIDRREPDVLRREPDGELTPAPEPLPIPAPPVPAPKKGICSILKKAQDRQSTPAPGAARPTPAPKPEPEEKKVPQVKEVEMKTGAERIAELIEELKINRAAEWTERFVIEQRIAEQHKAEEKALAERIAVMQGRLDDHLKSQPKTEKNGLFGTNFYLPHHVDREERQQNEWEDRTADLNKEIDVGHDKLEKLETRHKYADKNIQAEIEYRKFHVDELARREQAEKELKKLCKDEGYTDVEQDRVLSGCDRDEKTPHELYVERQQQDALKVNTSLDHSAAASDPATKKLMQNVADSSSASTEQDNDSDDSESSESYPSPSP